ncbi:hypothetical protein I350_07853, partial [Cryptococcus amylolentus CBS 6273]
MATVGKVVDLPRLLGKKNAQVWHHKLSAYFRAKGLSSYIEGVEKEPTQGDEAESNRARTVRAGSVALDMTGKEDQKDAWEEWRRKENECQGVILQTVNEDLYLDLSDLMSAAAMWAYITKLYALDNAHNDERQRRTRRELDNI